MPAAHDHDGSARGDRIEIPAIRQTLLFELRLVPVAVGDDHLVGSRPFHTFTNRRDDLVEGSSAREVHARAAPRAVEVPVGQTWHDQAPAKVDDSRRVPGELANGVARSDEDELAVPYRCGFRQRKGRVHGRDLAVDEHRVGGARGLSRRVWRRIAGRQ